MPRASASEMGLYDTPERRMGELSYQMWRATRLVVDTGIHAFGWDKARAIAFMRDNTALTEANIEAEVNRYISWPGQALGYMIGRLKILELRSARRSRRSATASTSGASTTRCCATARCRSTCSRARSTPGSRRSGRGRGEKPGRHLDMRSSLFRRWPEPPKEMKEKVSKRPFSFTRSAIPEGWVDDPLVSRGKPQGRADRLRRRVGARARQRQQPRPAATPPGDHNGASSRPSAQGREY